MYADARFAVCVATSQFEDALRHQINHKLTITMIIKRGVYLGFVLQHPHLFVDSGFNKEESATPNFKF